LAAPAASPALAADMAPPTLKPAPMAEPLVEWGSGWYLRGDASVTDQKLDPMMHLPGLVQGGKKNVTGFGADFGVGYLISDMVRVDATIGVTRRLDQRMATSYGCIYLPATSGACTETAKTRVDRYPMLANAYVDLGNYGGLRPYLGVGAGVALVREKFERTAVFNGTTSFHYSSISPTYGDTPLSGTKTRTNFAYALMAGVGYDISDGVSLDVGYRFLDMGSVKIENAGQGSHAKLREHQARIGLRYRID
jgi:opacity protein-like surface antigen